MNFKLLILLSLSTLLFSCATKTQKEFCLEKEIVSQQSCDKEWLIRQNAREEARQRQQDRMSEIGGARR